MQDLAVVVGGVVPEAKSDESPNSSSITGLPKEPHSSQWKAAAIIWRTGSSDMG